jgi:hypothetical protein
VLLRLTLIAVAAAIAILPIPSSFVEQTYSNGFYARLQAIVTPLTNLLPIALIDLFAAVMTVSAAFGLFRRVRQHGIRRALPGTALSLVTAAAIVYLAFVATWGLNYRRVPLEQKLDFQTGRLDRDAAMRLATIAVQQANATYGGAQQTPLHTDALEYAFVGAQQLLGASRFAAPGRPKRSILQLYFRRAAISGMTVPGFLEVILNPDLLPSEVPFTLAHEWAHLAGYADESEANFVAWLACVRSEDASIRYSGWLEAYGLALQAFPRSARASIPPLDEGPRRDLRAIYERVARASPRVRAVARDVYDSYLRANRVEEGIRSYDAALRLMLGTRFEENWKPVLR